MSDTCEKCGTYICLGNCDDWVIIDWAGNRIRAERQFEDFEDAWGYIREVIAPDDEEAWQEYEVLQRKDLP